MEDSKITSVKGRPRKTIREIIRKDLEINELDGNIFLLSIDQNMVYGTTLWCNLIHVADPKMYVVVV